MKIVIGSPFLYPAIAYGGAARAAYELASSLKELGHDVSVITTDVWDAHHRFNGTSHVSSFEIHRLKNFSNSMAYWCQFYTPMGLKQVEEVLADADILHLHTYRNLLNDRLARLAYQRRLPFVLTGHGTIPIVERFFKMKRAYDICIGGWQLNHASGFIAVSESEKIGMKKFGLPDSKIEVIPNGIPQIRSADPGKFRRKWKIAEDKKVILFLGKITERKGLQHLVNAFASVRRNAVLVIAGNDMGYEVKVLRIIRRLNIENRIIRTGILNDDEKASAFTDADVTVYPGHSEAFGLVAVESILCGTPVIVCDDDGCGEIVKRVGGGSLVSWGDIAGLTASIESLLEAKKDSDDIKKAGKLLLEQYSWDRIAHRTLFLYQQKLSREYV